MARGFSILLLSVLLQACASLLPGNSPMQTHPVEWPPRQSDALLILLPGIQDRADAFARNGFPAHPNYLGADVIAADAHWGYYRDRVFVERFHADVVTRARAAGYKDIYLLGVSLGAFGAMVYADEHPGEIRRLFLLAAYPGERDLVTELLDIGNLAAWPADSTAGDPVEHQAWRWLQRVASGSVDACLVFASGSEDRFHAANRLMATVVEPGHWFELPGNHDWQTWTRLWQAIDQARPGC